MTFSPASTATAAPTPERLLEHDIAVVMQAAIDHHHRQEYDQAAPLYTAILDLIHDHSEANYHLGVLRVQTGLPAEALPHFEAALGRAPDNGQYWVSYVNALVECGQIQAAEIALGMAVQRGVGGGAVDYLHDRIAINRITFPATTEASATAPGVETEQPATPGTLGPLEQSAPADKAPAKEKNPGRRASHKELVQHANLFNGGKIEAALKLALRLTAQYPSHGDCWRALAISLQRTGRFRESMDAAERAARMLPDDLLAQNLLADGLRVIGKWKESEAFCREVLARHPEFAEAHRILAMNLGHLARHGEAIDSVRRALELEPDNANLLCTLGSALLVYGRNDEAEAAYRKALELKPKNAITHSNMLFCMTHKIELDMATFLAEHREFATRHETPLVKRWTKHANQRNPTRRLRIGFVSADLRDHAVASYLLPALEYLARDDGLSLHFYSNNVSNDDVTARIRAHAQGWREVLGLTDGELAQKIRGDCIDILVDLSGHTGHNRLVTFAHKPAPVQASWIGYPATTGLKAIDYYISDRFFTPLDQFANQFTEKLAFLPAIAAFMPEPSAPAVNQLPASRNGYVTFGSFNRMNKIRPEVVALWARVLREVPNSRMLLGGVTGADEINRLATAFESEEIDVSRIAYLPRLKMTIYLQQHHLVDVCLDAFPYSASTTTLHALWMGVPTLTMPGDSPASRGSATWLSHMGLESLVARDKDDYVRKAVALAADIDALAHIRAGLRERCTQSPALSARSVASGLSRALRIMWRSWCDGLEPEHIDVSMQTGSTASAQDPAHSELEKAL